MGVGPSATNLTPFVRRSYNQGMPNADPALLRQLSENSLRYRDPVAAIDWSRLDQADFWLPEAALSLCGLPEFDVLAPEVRRRLSQYEFINVMLAGLWLERVFMQRVSRRLSPRLRLADLLARRAPAAGVLFWVATVIAEDVPDKFNRHLRSVAGVNPAVQEIC